MDESICPICQLSVTSFDLERHANSHFEDEELARDIELAQQIAFAPPSPPFVVNNRAKNDIPYETSARTSHESSTLRCDGKTSNVDERICHLIGLQTRAPFYKVEAGLIILLRKCLELDSGNSISVLSGSVDHFQSIESEDIGWGCGWRNIQMLSSHLLMQRQDAREVLFGGSGYVPDIASLQRWLEIAWQRGFDVLGSSHFNNQIYGKKNWIGTTECAALFRSFGLRARIVDFDSKDINSKSSTPGSHNVALGIKIFGPMDRYFSREDLNIPQPGFSKQEKSISSGVCIGNDASTSMCSSTVTRSLKGHQVLIDWIWNYFFDNGLAKLGNAHVIVTEKAPLYFQHDGHSRTIVGIQVKHQPKGMQQYNLLILDPAHETPMLERCLKKNFGWQKLIKRGVHTLKKPQYQLCYIDPGIACVKEMEQLKTLDSLKNDDFGVASNQETEGVTDQTTKQLDKHQEPLGQEENFLLHAIVAVLSFLIFGLPPPVIYGFSFRESDNKGFKLIAVAVASLLCIILLATGKACVRRPPKAVMYPFTIGSMVSGVSNVVGEKIKDTTPGETWFNSGLVLSLPILETTPDFESRVVWETCLKPFC